MSAQYDYPYTSSLTLCITLCITLFCSFCLSSSAYAQTVSAPQAGATTTKAGRELNEKSLVKKEGEQPETPSADQATPSVDQATPSADQATPSADQATPSADPVEAEKSERSPEQRDVGAVEDSSKTKTPPQPPIRARGFGRLAQRDSALQPKSGSWSIGLFNPLKIQLNDQWALESHPLVALASSPHLKLWHHWWSNQQVSVQGLYGFTTPLWSLQQSPPWGLAGYFSPSCQVSEEEPGRAPRSCQRPGFDVAPIFGARVSGRQGSGVWTIQGDLTAGLMITGERPAPLDTYAPLEMAFTPTTNHYRAHVGFSYAQSVVRSLSVKLEADLYTVGQPNEELSPPKSPVTVSSQLSFDWAMSQHLSITLGVIAWLSDQRAFELVEDGSGFVSKEQVMSIDLFPTFDLMWHY